MSDRDMQLLEQMVKHAAEDIKELREDMKDIRKAHDDLRHKQSITDNNVNQIQSMFKNLEDQIRALQSDWQGKMDEDRKRREKESREQIERYEQQERDAKNRWWGLVFLILGAMVLMTFNLK